MTGYREMTLFLYRYWSCCFEQDPGAALQHTLEFNNLFTHPLPEREVIRATKSAQKAYGAKSDKAANERAKAMGYPGAGYRISNAKIISWLEITEEEQQHMKTIIGTKEKNRRKRIAYHENKDVILAKKEQQRREAGMRPMEEYNQERHEAKMTKAEILRQTIQEHPDLSNRKLAALLGWSEPTVRRLKKHL